MMSEEADEPRVEVSRPAFNLEGFHHGRKRKKDGERDQSDGFFSSLRGRLLPATCATSWPAWRSRSAALFPILDWLGGYDLRRDLSADLVAGFTVAIMHIPQGMAYANLAELDPIYGIYTAIFPVIVYTLLGPSRHVSMGTNPLTSILIGAVVARYAIDSNGSSVDTGGDSGGGASILPPHPTLTDSGASADAGADDQAQANSSSFTKTELMTSLALLVGLWQTGFAILRLGKLSWILSEVLVSGYTTAAAVHVLASQLKGILGIPLGSHPGPLKLVNVLVELFHKISAVNWASFLISLACVAALVLNNEIFKPELAKHCSFPLPIQLVVVVVGTVLSFYFDFAGRYGVDTVGVLPTGFPRPVVPNTSVFPNILVESLIIAVVGYCITLSMAKIFAAKFGYRVDGNQEMLGEGASNIFGSFFMSMPSGASMSRSAVQVSVGGRTQLTSAVSVSFLSVVILFAGPLFATLPKAVLSSIIVVALKGMLLQYHDFKKFWSKSKLDGLLWMLAFSAVLLLDVDSGLVVGIAVNLAVLVYRSIRVRVNRVSEVGDTGIFVEEEDDKAEDQQDIVVLRLGGAITFANYEAVLEEVEAKTESAEGKVTILDLSSVPYVDQNGAKTVKKWVEADSKAAGGDRLLAAPTAKVRSMLLKFAADKEAEDLLSSSVCPSLVDAARISRKCLSDVRRRKEEDDDDDHYLGNGFSRTTAEAEEGGGGGGGGEDSGISRSGSRSPSDDREDPEAERAGAGSTKL